MHEPAVRQYPRPARERLTGGGLDLLTLLARLLRRPRRGDRQLPLLWLTRAPGSADVAALLRRFLGQGADRRVPHAVVDLSARPETDDVPAVLRELHRQLSGTPPTPVSRSPSDSRCSPWPGCRTWSPRRSRCSVAA
ncbi:hypothetical protein [Micromonospora mirobrigensis]|uniref:Uncharacterized protein n=1 Tax=Micromonospora mirobrigensis TaxID=262898 RepID=A0A1C5AA30_9ACTN|nr:hypothetical protein [Micromonospora mirobrigensis]SCF41986.1 hypothetical protein GA0070564_108179 [Micromonospora mirobrigensis]